MEAAPVHIIQYFDGSKQGVIPLFQRPYSWEQKDWKTLWSDLMGQYEVEDRTSHFMGALVTVPVKSVPVGVGKHLVIDGQQRLTTISILLAAIRDKATDTATEGIIGDLLRNRHYDSPDDLKLVPTQADRAAYNALVYGKDLSEHEESRIIQAYRYFMKQLDGVDDNDQPILPSQTLQAIQQSLQVVMINLGESDDPYLIFESLNHKGKPLNQADLVRNYALMRFQHSTSTGGEQEVIYEELWRPMETSLGEAMPEFLRHYGMRHGKNVRKGDIYTVAKGEFEKEKDSSGVRSKLLEMKLAALTYEKFLKPDEEGNERLAGRLRGILELDSTVFYPLLILLYRGWQKEQFVLDELVDALDTLESFYVRRSTCGVPTNGINRIMLETCSNFPSDSVGLWLRERLAKGTSGSRWPSDDEFESSVVTQRLYPRRRLARYMLIALEESFDHKEPVNPTSATMEHVMPQTLSATWRNDLGAGCESIHDEWLDTIGNLTLTGYNTELGNSPFSEKKEKLKHTHFELSKSILLNDNWGADEIRTRGEMMAKRALKRWRRD